MEIDSRSMEQTPTQLPPPHAPAPPPAPGPAPRPTNTLAIISFALGVAAFVVLPIIGAIGAIVTGHMARGEIRRTGEGGRALATWGLVLGYLHLVIGVLLVAAVVLVIVVWSLGIHSHG